MRKFVTSPFSPRGRPWRIAAGAAAVALIATGTALAAAPSINIRGPQTATVGTPFKVKVSGYFNNTKAHPFSGANFAVVVRLPGHVDATAKQCRKHGTFIAGGPQDKRLRAKTPTTPGHFFARVKVKTPKAGKFTLCGLLGNYPAGGYPFKRHALFHYTVQ